MISIPDTFFAGYVAGASAASVLGLAFALGLRRLYAKILTRANADRISLARKNRTLTGILADRYARRF